MIKFLSLLDLFFEEEGEEEKNFFESFIRVIISQHSLFFKKKNVFS